MRLSSIPNFRDCGGLPTADGRQLRGGRLFRAEALAVPDDRDAERLTSLPLTLVCDLRSTAERARRGSPYVHHPGARLVTGPDTRHTPTADLAKAFADLAGQSAAAVAQYMTALYTQLPMQFADLLGELLQHLADGHGPAMVHCTAGKDRTGVVCALVQHALGVPAAMIEADYMASDTHLGAERLARYLRDHYGQSPPDDLIDMMRVRPEYLDAALRSAAAQFGSVDGYLQQAAGLTDDRRAALHQQLLQPVSAT
jgi:protein-tyrosine phosphatase